MSTCKYGKMTKEEIRVWVKELRSDKYTQCFGNLSAEDEYGHKTFCALGVYCKYLAKKNKKSLKWGEDMGLDRIPNNLIDKVVTMNDDKEKSFSEIADYIENKYL